MQQEIKNRKLRCGFSSSCPNSRTGFSNHLRTLLKYLYTNYSDQYEFYVLAQGGTPSPESKDRFPWQTKSVFEYPVDQSRWGDGNYQRFVAYGNNAIQPWVTNTQLDILFAIEDVWHAEEQVYLKSNWFQKIKKNFVLWSTADSLPILPSFKTWSKELGKNMWFWTSFAEKALKDEDFEKYKEVQTVYGCLDSKEWSPINDAEKFELRNKFGIPKDTKLNLCLSRNQLRKMFPNVLEAFSKYIQRNPSSKSALVFHTSWSEGWDLKRLIEEFKIDNSRIYTTYYCRACNHWEVKNFTGENQPCKKCGVKDSQITAGVQSTISNKDLSKIYGMCDSAISAYNSGGFEFHSAQSLLMELPLLCSDYSCGEDFCDASKENGIYPLDGNFYFELGTLFKKQTPNQNTIIKFLKTIDELPEQKRKEIGKKGRKWGVENFDVKIVGERVKSFIDSCEPIDWSDYRGEGGNIKQYNPNVVVDSSLEGNELIKSLYHSILGMDLEPSDQGFQNWAAQLAQGAPKDQIISYFRSVANQEIQKLSGASSIEDLFDKQDREIGLKRILLTLPETIGDLILAQGLLPSIRERYPKDQWKIYFACKPEYFSVLEGNKYIDKLIQYQPVFDNLLQMEGAGDHKGFVDINYIISAGTQKFLTYLHNGSNIHDLELYPTRERYGCKTFQTGPILLP